MVNKSSKFFFFFNFDMKKAAGVPCPFSNNLEQLSCASVFPSEKDCQK